MPDNPFARLPKVSDVLELPAVAAASEAAPKDQKKRDNAEDGIERLLRRQG